MIIEIISYSVLIYFSLDLLILLINSLMNVGDPNRCAKDGWISAGLVLNSSLKPNECPSQIADPGIRAVGKWRKYAVRDEEGNLSQCLYEQQVDEVVRDIQQNYIIEGYTPIQLLSYVIVPTATALSIGFWLISTRANKAEWTFWIMIVTLIYTGLSSVVQETAGMDVTPESVSCLTHVSDTLGLQNGDELKYSFMARRQQGDNCFMEGTYLATAEGGIADPSQPAVYNGDIPKCNAEEMPMY